MEKVTDDQKTKYKNTLEKLREQNEKGKIDNQTRKFLNRQETRFKNEAFSQKLNDTEKIKMAQTMVLKYNQLNNKFNQITSIMKTIMNGTNPNGTNISYSKVTQDMAREKIKEIKKIMREIDGVLNEKLSKRLFKPFINAFEKFKAWFNTSRKKDVFLARMSIPRYHDSESIEKNQKDTEYFLKFNRGMLDGFSTVERTIAQLKMAALNISNDEEKTKIEIEEVKQINKDTSSSNGAKNGGTKKRRFNKKRTKKHKTNKRNKRIRITSKHHHHHH